MQTVSNKFREREYSGGALYKCHLTINNTSIPVEQIAKIIIKSPIIDTTSETFYIGTFISQSITIKFKNLDGIDIQSNYEVSLSIGQDIYDEQQQTTTEEIVPMGVFLIDDLAENYQTTCEITCMDYAVKFKPNIDYSPCFVDNKANVNTIIQYICTYFGVTLGTNLNNLPNGDIEVGTYDSTVSGKQWLSYLAETKGCNLKMSRTGQLLFIPFKKAQPDITINALESAAFELGEKYKISQVTYFDAVRNYTYGEDTDNTLYIRQDNPFISDTNVVKNIYDAVKNFEIWSLKNKNYGDISLDAWDLIQFTLGTDENDDPITYQTYNDNVITYEMNISTEINTQIPTKQKEVTTNIVGGNTDTKIKRLRTSVNNIENELEIVVEEQDELTDKMSELTIAVDEIEAQISDIPTITTEAEGTGTLSLTNLANIKLISLKVHPTTDDIIGLFASNELNVRNGLTALSRGITFEGKEKIYYLIPKNLYQYNDVYDEFIYDGVNSRINIIHRIGFDANENKYVLETPVIEELEYQDIIVSEGNNSVYMGSYPSAYIYINAMLKNDYTSTFATKIELNSSITQTTNDISLQVSRKVNDNKIISSINLSPEKAEINAEKISLAGKDIDLTADNIKISSTKFNVDEEGNMSCNDANVNGTITATSGKIGRYDITNTYLETGTGNNNTGIGGQAAFWAGNDSSMNAPFHVTYDGSLYASSANITGNISGSTITGGTITGTQITSNTGTIAGWTMGDAGLSNNTGFYVKNTGLSNIYTMSDIFICSLILQGYVSITSGTPEFSHYDLNNDGVIDSRDMLAIRNLFNQ